MFIVGLTGGVGTGKSSASRIFSELNVPVIDADVISRELTAAGTEYHQKIVDLIGPGILGSDGTIDRNLLGSTVFNDRDKRLALENLLHPVIIQTMLDRASEVSSPYLVFSIPLLVEADLGSIVNRVLVIDAPEELQIERVIKRDRRSRDEVMKIIASQADRQQRLLQADDILVNEGDLDMLRSKITVLHQKYTEMALSI